MPNIDYVTRDRDGVAVCVQIRLRVPGVAGFIVLDSLPNGQLIAVPADSGPRLSPTWLPAARK